MTSKHSPSPWREDKYGNLVCYPESLEIGIFSGQLPKAELEANTRLVLSAPEILSALKLACELLEYGGFDLEKFHAAIAKAEGK